MKIEFYIDGKRIEGIENYTQINISIDMEEDKKVNSEDIVNAYKHMNEMYPNLGASEIRLIEDPALPDNIMYLHMSSKNYNIYKENTEKNG